MHSSPEFSKGDIKKKRKKKEKKNRALTKPGHRESEECGYLMSVVLLDMKQLWMMILMPGVTLRSVIH